MRLTTIIFLLIIGLISVQCNTGNRSPSNKQSSRNNDRIKTGKLIGKPLTSIIKKESELGLRLIFEKIESYFFDIDNNGVNDEIIIERIKDWSDPGDFHRIVIKSNDEQSSFFNPDGWVKTGDYETQFYKRLSSENLVKSHYINIHQLSSTEVILMSFGYTYASQPGLLSIINLTNTPHLIFNDNYYLYSLNDIDSNGEDDITVTKYDKDEIFNKIEATKIFKFNNGWLEPLAD